MRYAVLVVIYVILRDVVMSASWGLVGTQYSITSLRVDHVGLARLINSVLGVVPCLAEGEISSVQVRFFVLTWSHRILKSLECLVQFLY